MASTSKLFVAAHRALLPGNESPKPATLEVDTTTGKIVAVHDRLLHVQEEGVTFIEVPDTKILLPGLIE